MIYPEYKIICMEHNNNLWLAACQCSSAIAVQVSEAKLLHNLKPKAFSDNLGNKLKSRDLSFIMYYRTQYNLKYSTQDVHNLIH